MSADPKNAPLTEEPLSSSCLKGATKYVRHVIFLAELNLVVAASSDGSVRVYDIDTTGEPTARLHGSDPCAIFRGHTDYVYGVAQLEDDMVASVGMDGKLCTWRAATAQLVATWEHTSKLHFVAKLGNSAILVGDVMGTVSVLLHTAGSSFQIHHHLHRAHSSWVNDIVVHGDVFVTCSADKTAKVWDSNTLALRATLPHDGLVQSAAVSDQYIVTACDGSIIRVFDNAPGYSLLFELPLVNTKFVTGGVDFLSDDVIVVAAGYFLYSISLPAKAIISRVRMGKPSTSFAVLRNERIAVCGLDAYCAIITPPKAAQGGVNASVSSLYPSSSKRLTGLTPDRPSDTSSEDIAAPREVRATHTTKESSTSMAEWRAKGISKKVMQQLESGDAAACFVAFLLNYESDNEAMYYQLKGMMKQVFRKKRIYGASFIEADKDEKKELHDVLLAALKDVTDPDAKRLTGMWIKKFTWLASQ